MLVEDRRGDIAGKERRRADKGGVWERAESGFVDVERREE
jgi:hypothetical protein